MPVQAEPFAVGTHNLRPQGPTVKRYILTGAPGAGKTTILRRLKADGFDVVDEAATAVIAREQAEGDAEPWTRQAFVEKVVGLQRRRQLRSATRDVTHQIYDRSPICTQALTAYLGRPAPAALLAARSTGSPATGSTNRRSSSSATSSSANPLTRVGSASRSRWFSSGSMSRAIGGSATTSWRCRPVMSPTEWR
ncbi:AAA family ATPase [Streptomyces sp. L7]